MSRYFRAIQHIAILSLFAVLPPAFAGGGPMAPALPGELAMEKVRPVPKGRFDLPTDVPFTYIRDYKNNHVNNPEYVKLIAENPPELRTSAP